FNEMVQAAVTYIAQWPIKKIQQSIGVGASVRIGPCSLAAAGISFQTQGLLFKKDRFIPWPHVSTKMRNGRIVVMDERYIDFSVEVLLRDIDNAVLLPLLPKFSNSRSH